MEINFGGIDRKVNKTGWKWRVMFGTPFPTRDLGSHLCGKRHNGEREQGIEKPQRIGIEGPEMFYDEGAL